MGLFGKKPKIPEGIRAVYYEGELKEFPANYACQLLLQDDILRITKINPYVEVRLARDRISLVELYSEQEYMQKFKGSVALPIRKEDIPKAFYVFQYTDKEGVSKHLDFWAASSEAFKMSKLKDELMKNQKPTSYEI